MPSKSPTATGERRSLKDRRAGDLDRHIGARIRERRISAGLSQQQFADDIGVSYQQAHKYETGKNRVSAAQLFKIAKALGVEVAYFYEGYDPANPIPCPPVRRQTMEMVRDFETITSPQARAQVCSIVRTIAAAHQPAAYPMAAE